MTRADKIIAVIAMIVIIAAVVATIHRSNVCHSKGGVMIRSYCVKPGSVIEL